MKATFEVSGRKYIIFAPAFPAAGRTTRNGRQFVDGEQLNTTTNAHDPLHPIQSDRLADVLGDFGVHAVSIAREKIDTLHAHADPVLIVNVETQSDLDMLVKRIPRPEECLWVGSPGLAQALAKRFGCSQKVSPAHLARHQGTPRRVLVAIGSINPARRKQIRHLSAAGIPILSMGDYPSDTSRVVCAVTPDSRNEKPGQILKQFSKYVSGLIKDNDFDALIVTGGETANKLLGLTGVTMIELYGELSPGFPFGRTVGPSPLTVALKAGGFGKADALYNAATTLLYDSEVET